MDVKECYEVLHADYASVLDRLGTDERIYKFLTRYVGKQEYRQLELAIEEKRWQDAFFTVHNMKGYGLNLSLTAFAEASSALCEALRGGEPTEEIAPLVLAVKQSYEQIEEAVNRIDTF